MRRDVVLRESGGGGGSDWRFGHWENFGFYSERSHCRVLNRRVTESDLCFNGITVNAL